MIVFDLETQNLAAQVGGWQNKNLMRLAVACTWDERQGYRLWWESQAADLIAELGAAPLIVGFNVNSFDYQVLSYYGDTEGLPGRTFDILDEIWKQAGRRRGSNLDALCNRNLGEAKSLGSGADAVELWRTGRLEELAAYCQRDVELTRYLFEYWEAGGMLWINDIQYALWPGTNHITDRKRRRRRGRGR